MADPLLSYAAEVAPVRPTTRFFEPGDSLGIMQRYGMSAANRAFAEDALKSANEIDAAANYDPIHRRNTLEAHEWERQAKDKDDLKYQEKKEFEATLGTFLVDFAKLDTEDPEFDSKVAKMIADPRALDNEAVKAVYNLKIGQREQANRDNSQRLDYERRLADELSSISGRPATDFVDDKGFVNRTKAGAAFRGVTEAKAQKEQSEKDFARDAEVLGEADAPLLQRPREENLKLRSQRTADLFNAAKAQGLSLLKGAAKEVDGILDSSPGITEEAFVAQVVNLGKVDSKTQYTDPTAQALAAFKGDLEVPPGTRQMIDAARGIWRANRAANRTRYTPPKDDLPPDTDAAKTAEEIRRKLKLNKPAG